MTDITDPEEPKTEKWYNSPLARTLGTPIGLGVMCTLVLSGLGLSEYLRDRDEVAKARARVSEARAEYQRLRTIEELTEKYGHRMNPQELDALLEKYHLNRSLELMVSKE